MRLKLNLRARKTRRGLFNVKLIILGRIRKFFQPDIFYQRPGWALFQPLNIFQEIMLTALSYYLNRMPVTQVANRSVDTQVSCPVSGKAAEKYPLNFAANN